MSPRLLCAEIRQRANYEARATRLSEFGVERLPIAKHNGADNDLKGGNHSAKLIGFGWGDQSSKSGLERVVLSPERLGRSRPRE